MLIYLFGPNADIISVKDITLKLPPTFMSEGGYWDGIWYTYVFMDNDQAVYRYGGEDVDAVHPQQGQDEPRHQAELPAQLPAKLEGRHKVHRHTVDRHDQLRDGDVHQEKVKLRLELRGNIN